MYAPRFYVQPVVHSGFGQFAVRAGKAWRVGGLTSVIISPALSYPYANKKGKRVVARA